MLITTDESRAKSRPAEIREKTRQVEADSISYQNHMDRSSVGSLVAQDLSATANQIGRPLLIQEVIRRFQSINPALHFEVANNDPELMGVYILHPKPVRPGSDERREFISRMHRGPWVPEFQVYKPKLVKRPDPSQKMNMQQVETIDDMLWGYRTVAARLIRRRAITQAQVDRVFGTPSLDLPSWGNAVNH